MNTRRAPVIHLTLGPIPASVATFVLFVAGALGVVVAATPNAPNLDRPRFDSMSTLSHLQYVVIVITSFALGLQP